MFITGRNSWAAGVSRQTIKKAVPVKEQPDLYYRKENIMPGQLVRQMPLVAFPGLVPEQDSLSARERLHTS